MYCQRISNVEKGTNNLADQSTNGLKTHLASPIEISGYSKILRMRIADIPADVLSGHSENSLKSILLALLQVG